LNRADLDADAVAGNVGDDGVEVGDACGAGDLSRECLANMPALLRNDKRAELPPTNVADQCRRSLVEPPHDADGVENVGRHADMVECVFEVATKYSVGRHHSSLHKRRMPRQRRPMFLYVASALQTRVRVTLVAVYAPAELTDRLVADLVSEGAHVVALTGSYARGNATRRSDLDVIVIGEAPRYVVEMRHGLLVAQAWSTEAEQRRRFGDPREVGAAVPGWREAVILHDPDARGARLKEEALAWSWQQIDELSDEWVADQLVGYAEEVQKLVEAVESQNVLTAAVLRTLLAFRMPRIVSVYHRLLYGSENVRWDQVAPLLRHRPSSARREASRGRTSRVLRHAEDRSDRYLAPSAGGRGTGRATAR